MHGGHANISIACAITEYPAIGSNALITTISMGKAAAGTAPSAAYLPAPQDSIGNLSRFTSAHSQPGEDGALPQHSRERSTDGTQTKQHSLKPSVTLQERTLDGMVDDMERRKKRQHKAALPLRGLKLGPITIFYTPLLLTLMLLTVSISFIIWAPDASAYAFPIWKIFMFFALMYPLLVLSDIIVFIFVLLLERVFLRVQFVLYFIMGSRVRTCVSIHTMHVLTCCMH